MLPCIGAMAMLTLLLERATISMRTGDVTRISEQWVHSRVQHILSRHFPFLSRFFPFSPPALRQKT